LRSDTARGRSCLSHLGDPGEEQANHNVEHREHRAPRIDRERAQAWPSVDVDHSYRALEPQRDERRECLPS